VNEVTRILAVMRQGDSYAAEQLLPLVYEELRRLAAQKLTHEIPGQTLNATALVHEAYLRLVDVENEPHWENRGHFFACAAEAMRRILIEQARRRIARERCVGPVLHVDLERVASEGIQDDDDLLAVHEALTDLEQHDERAGRLVKLRYFAGLSHQEAAAAMGLSRGVADDLWALAKVWLYRRLHAE
jgi:RNA polymerase sigma factor (TIGR02999 family)